LSRSSLHLTESMYTRPARSILLCSTCLFCSILHANGHAYVYWPASRNRLKFYYLAQSQNSPKSASGTNPKSGFNDYKSKHGPPPPGRSGPRSDTAWAWDLCGMGPDPGQQAIGDSTFNWAGPTVATYQQGGQITFTVVVNGEHGGAHEWRLCPKKVDASMSVREAAECLDSILIGRDCTPGQGCGCADDKCKDKTPHNDEKDPFWKTVIKNATIPVCPGNSYFDGKDGKCIRTKPDHMQFGAHQFTYTLPKGVSCDHCTVQWYWATAFGEWFRNCMDIKIEGPPTPAPTPAPPPQSRRRRRSSRRRSSRRRSTRRRRRSTRRRRSSTRRRRSTRRRAKTAASGTASKALVPRETEVDLEYEDLGCFPLSEGDDAADHLDCDCDIGKGPVLYNTLRDFTCMDRQEGTVCRGGLPFYRLLVNKESAPRLCFAFCSSKGADLFGLLGQGNKSSPTAECRCGASVTNYKFWKAAGHKISDSSPLPHSSLLLDGSSKLPECSSAAVHVFSYEGWKRFSGSSGVQDALLDVGDEDKDYMMSIVKGTRFKKGKPL